MFPKALIILTVLQSFSWNPAIHAQKLVAGTEEGQRANLRPKKKNTNVLKRVSGKFRSRTRKQKEGSASVLFPGVVPEDYSVSDEIPMLVDPLISDKSSVPYDYYNMPVCDQSIRKADRVRKNLGAKLQGSSAVLSPFDINVLRNVPCTQVCDPVLVSPRDVGFLAKLVKANYKYHMSLDSLPVLSRQGGRTPKRGFPVGFLGTDKNIYLYNHLLFQIFYNYKEGAKDDVNIVGFEVIPLSYDHESDGDSDGEFMCDEIADDPATRLNLFKLAAERRGIIYSYEVVWLESETKWIDRWDIYLLGSPGDKIKYFGVMNSFMLGISLTFIIFAIMLRSLKKDIAAYNADIDDGEDNETGWKLTHGDVFRPPQTYAIFLSAAVGTGIQIGIAIILTLLFAVAGLITPMKKGSTLTTIIILYVCCGGFAGYTSSRIYKFSDGKHWKKCTILTANAFSGLLVSMFVVLDLFLAYGHAATTVSISTIIQLFFLWACVSNPIVFIGSYFGFRADKISVPVKVNQIARFVPYGPWYTQSPFQFVMSGFLPFGCLSIETLFIMAAVWLHQIYYAVGFLLAIVLILIVITAEMSAVMTLLQLNAENHRWWWPSFFNGASIGAYLFLYSLWFLSFKLQYAEFLSILVFITYMGMVSLSIGLFCGSVGFISSFFFNKIIYAQIKID